MAETDWIRYVGGQFQQVDKEKPLEHTQKWDLHDFGNLYK